MKPASLRSLVLAALTVLVLSFVLSGCGGSSGSSDHTSEWNNQDVTAFVAEIQGQFDSELPSLGTSEVGKKIIACSLEKVKPAYSPKSIGEAKNKPALEAIGRGCAEMHKPEVEAAVKKEAEEKQAAGATGETGAGETSENQAAEEGSGATGTTESTGTETH